MNIVILGLSITSSWGNGHATTYRSLIRGLQQRGHEVLFLERDVPWYAANRDLPHPPYCRTVLYSSFGDLTAHYRDAVAAADLVITGSYVPDGVSIGHWVCDTARGLTAFYDIDTPVTLAKLARSDFEYLTPDLIPRYHLYLSFCGGPTLRQLEQQHGAQCARVLYCSVDPAHYYPETATPRWDLAYLGTYSEDRQPALDRLLLEPARRWPDGRFFVAGPMYPGSIVWPNNVHTQAHLPPAEHRAFYNAQRFTLNVTRADMIAAGWSPSVRLFEAAACATPILSDSWPGLEMVFEPRQEIRTAQSSEEALDTLRHSSEADRACLASRARARVLRCHTGYHRAAELEHYYRDLAPTLVYASSSPMQ